jgi:hypothetical protein
MNRFERGKKQSSNLGCPTFAQAKVGLCLWDDALLALVSDSVQRSPSKSSDSQPMQSGDSPLWTLAGFVNPISAIVLFPIDMV